MFIFYIPGVTFSQIYINEFQAYNASCVLDRETGNYSDWLELFNSGDEYINIGGYWLTDDPGYPAKWLIPEGTSVAAGEYMIIWADKLDNGLHTNFTLEGSGGEILLSNRSNQIVDSVSYSRQIPNISMGRDSASSLWFFMDKATPSEKNGIPLSSVEFSAKPSASLNGGFYPESISVELTCSLTGAFIRYTTDGSQPDESSYLFTTPILINKTTVLRAISFKDTLLPSEVLTHTYFINADHSLPVVSVATDNRHLWDTEEGIYTQDNCTEDWERPATIELYDNDGSFSFSHRVGISIHGGYNQILPMKSLAVRARNKYETGRINAKLFKDKDIDQFTSFILRNSGNDWSHSMLRDGFMQTIVKDRMDVDYQEYQPAVVYLNGEYWGIHNIREKTNEYYLEGNHGTDPENVDILDKGFRVSEGDYEAYQDLIEYITTHDMRNPAYYAVVKERIDIEELINYQIAQIYFNNQDWPNNNMKKWRPRTDNGLWRWFLFDTDWGFGLFQDSDNMVNWTFSQNKWYENLNTLLLRNDEHKSEFLQCFQGHMNTSFKPERVVNILDSLAGNIATEMPGHIARWGVPSGIPNWEDELAEMSEFAESRISVLKNELNNYFYLGGEYTLSANINIHNSGHIRITHVDIPDNFTGTYYRNRPIQLEAIPAKGYRFIGWEGASNSSMQEIELTLAENASITANFELSSPILNIDINEFSSDSENAIQDEMGEFEDWIELYNSGDKPVDISGLYLSDSIELLSMHEIDNSGAILIYPDSTVLFFADDDPEQGPYHLNFKLSNDGEEIFLSQLVGTDIIIIDSAGYEEQYAGAVTGRIPDGKGEWQLCRPTPGKNNLAADSIYGLYINEFSASNSSIISDEYGEYDDWIEIFNSNDEPVDIGGLFLTDSLPDRTKYRIPTTDPDSTTIPGKGYLVLWADNQEGQGILHLDFGLTRDGEQIGLVPFNGVGFIDSLSYREQHANSSLSCYPDGEGNWQVMRSTPGNSNVPSVSSGLYINEFSASNSSIISDEYGEYDDWIEIYNSNDEPVDIGGLFLTDSLPDRTKYRIPTTDPDSTTIPGKGYLVLWADNQEGQGILHLDFGLTRDGEQIGLAGYNGNTIIDSLTYNSQYYNSSVSRYPVGDSSWQLVPSSPGTVNEYYPVTGLIINEFSASNFSIAGDEYGEYGDWIEIYNSNDEPVDIGGLFLTDSLPDLTKYRIPITDPDSTTIPGKGYLVLWADNQEGQGILHLDFGLNRDGEQIGLVPFNGEGFLDSLTYREQYTNSSVSRLPDGAAKWQIIPPTPWGRNRYPEVNNLYINEFSASNRLIRSDEFGEYHDWIEIYNDNKFAVDLGGLFITDSLADGTKFRIPSTCPDSTTISGKGYLFLWADNMPERGILHLNFGLSRSGEQIGLLQYNGIDLIDSISYGEQLVNSSLSRYPDGQDYWIFMNSTPGGSNVREEYARLYINEFMAGESGAISDDFNHYCDWIEIYNHNEYEVDLGGLFITDSLAFPQKFRISTSCADSTTVPPYGFLVLWADNDPDQGILHLNFKLDEYGDEIGLSYREDMGFVFIDTVVYKYQNNTISTGRVNDGVNSWTNFTLPSPGCSNRYKVTGTPVFTNEDLIVYPNPVTGDMLFLTYPRNVKLYNAMGILVYKAEFTSKLLLSGYSPGIYFLHTGQGEVLQIVIP